MFGGHFPAYQNLERITWLVEVEEVWEASRVWEVWQVGEVALQKTEEARQVSRDWKTMIELAIGKCIL